MPVFGRGQVTTYLLAGLGDTREAILAMCERLIALGVYPFVVPFVPIAGTPLESHPAPVAGLHARDPRAARRMLRDGRPARGRHQGRLRQVRRLLVAVHL